MHISFFFNFQTTKFSNRMELRQIFQLCGITLSTIVCSSYFLLVLIVLSLILQIFFSKQILDSKKYSEITKTPRKKEILPFTASFLREFLVISTFLKRIAIIELLLMIVHYYELNFHTLASLNRYICTVLMWQALTYHTRALIMGLLGHPILGNDLIMIGWTIFPFKKYLVIKLIF